MKNEEMATYLAEATYKVALMQLKRERPEMLMLKTKIETVGLAPNSAVGEINAFMETLKESMPQVLSNVVYERVTLAEAKSMTTKLAMPPAESELTTEEQFNEKVTVILVRGKDGTIKVLKDGKINTAGLDFITWDYKPLVDVHTPEVMDVFKFKNNIAVKFRAQLTDYDKPSTVLNDAIEVFMQAKNICTMEISLELYGDLYLKDMYFIIPHIPALDKVGMEVQESMLYQRDITIHRSTDHTVSDDCNPVFDYVNFSIGNIGVATADVIDVTLDCDLNVSKIIVLIKDDDEMFFNEIVGRVFEEVRRSGFRDVTDMLFIKCPDPKTISR